MSEERGFYGPDEDDDWGDLAFLCTRCANPGDDACEACGAPLCHMHFELGAGFCGRCDIETYMKERGVGNSKTSSK